MFGRISVGISMMMGDVLQHVIRSSACVLSSQLRLQTQLLLKMISVMLLVFLPVKQDPIVGGKPPRSPILSRRSYLSPVRGRRVGGMSSLNQTLTMLGGNL